MLFECSMKRQKEKKNRERLWDMNDKEKISTIYLIGALEREQREIKEDDFFFLDNVKNLP